MTSSKVQSRTSFDGDRSPSLTVDRVQEQQSNLVRQQMVVNQIREMILAGELGAGEKLTEVSMSERMGVSRTPIREALIVLSEEGLVEYRLNRGYSVREFTIKYVLDAYITREAIESVACRLAAEKGPSEDVRAEMKALLIDADRILSQGGLKDEYKPALRENNHRFHQLIFQTADNEVLTQALQTATNIPYSSSRVAHWFREDDPDGLYSLRAFHAQHHAIYKAICNGEGYRAETIMRGHIANAAEQIREQLVKAGRLDETAQAAEAHGSAAPARRGSAAKD
ncbi:MAG: GntR family transcriptional regulator [Novosphingobium sp.]|uniref:GntR family transcriptional regulator n=1 Tax=Novosphingobium sp. TaxID=1874826 RepID=UPI0027331C9D|nr:GntR family transcriptional regulator [Novosphingobium sp.]MDP3550763.1 GntR family transcriptional regulator [Novosphingobium sp.]